MINEYHTTLLTHETARAQVVPAGRLQKWEKMCQYGLNDEYKKKIILERNHGPTDPIKFSKYAIIGLKNFSQAFPILFLSRLSKGPPPQYRWLAWKVALSK